MVGQQNGNGAVGGAAGLTEEEAGTLSQSQTETNAWGELVSLNACHESCQIVQNTMFMGRKDACKLKFDDPRISSLHARIERVLDGPADSGVAVVHDLSSNGTFVNGEKVGKGNSTHIKDDDMISLVVVPAKGPDGTYTHSDESMKKVFVAYTFRFLAPTQPPASITASQPSLISAATTALASGAVDARVDAEQKELNELVKTLTAKNNKTQFEKDFEQSTMLGEGGFAKVYIGVHRESKKKVAVKVIDVEKWKLNRGTLRASQIEDEISIHQQLSHPNVVRLLWCYTARRYIHIVLEKVDGGDLFDYLVNNCTSGSGLEGELCRRWFNDLLRAVDYMHSNGVVHRDLKPENILLDREDETATLKISDFGLAKVNAGSAACQTRCGTINYMAPEVAAVGGAGGSEIYGKEADMWGLGVILHVMVSLTMPFEGEESETEQKLIEMAKSGKGNLKLLQGECWRGQPTELKALLKHLLTPDTKRRATMVDALASPWVQGTEGAGKRKDAGDEERGGGGTRKRGRKG